MTGRPLHHDLRAVVVVPARPGPVRRLRDVDRGRDDIDDALDELFGESDDRGPGVFDAALVVGGTAAIVGGLVASLPVAIVVCGVGAVGLGAVLPVRSLWRRVGSARRAAQVRDLLGDGVALRIDAPSTERLLAAHDQLWRAGEPLAEHVRARVRAVAHGALFEVASLLDGRAPATEAEIAYVIERCDALDELAATVADPRTGDGDVTRRQAVVEARREIEQLTGTSSLTDAADLARELRGGDAR